MSGTTGIVDEEIKNKKKKRTDGKKRKEEKEKKKGSDPMIRAGWSILKSFMARRDLMVLIASRY